MNLPKITLRPKREVPLKAGHPWVFSNAIENVEGDVSAGDLVAVFDFAKEPLGIGTCNPKNSIRVRMLTRDIDEKIDEAWMAKKLKFLDEDKKRFLPPKTTGYRIAHADADFLPGLILDRYGENFVFQIHTAGMEKLRPYVVAGIKKAFKPKSIIERSDIEARTQEGLQRLKPKIIFGDIKDFISFTENGIKFYVDPLNGQKTGFFLDQRKARMKLKELSEGKTVLNLFSYTGAFSVYAAIAKAKSVTTIDISKPAIDMAKKNFELNKLDPDDSKYTFLEADVLDFLNEHDKNYDLIICDPPAFAKSLNKTENALRAYGELNEKCFKRLNPNGILITSSCSGRVTVDDFKHVLKIAAGRARKDAKIIDFIGQPYDHTERLAYPEGSYLKTFVIGV